MIALVAAAALSVPVERFRWERPLRPAGRGPVELVADGPLFAHTRDGFADLRVVDGRGRQVPWRQLPEQRAVAETRLPLLDAGRRGRFAVARVDLGPARPVVDRIELGIPDARFVGSVTVLGSDDRRTWTRLSTTQIYAVGGAAPARSTTALLPPSDFRWLELRATGVSRIDAASVAGRGARPPALRRIPASVHPAAGGVVVDLGYRNVPVDELRISAATRRYDRPFEVLAGGEEVAAGELVRLGPPRVTVVPLAARGRRLRIVVQNGDDPPLRGIRVEALARPRTLLVEGGHPAPLTLLYGAAVAAPDYDYARLPVRALALERARPGTLGPELRNPAFRTVDRRSFVDRHRSLVTAALAVAAAALVAAGALALRRTAA